MGENLTKKVGGEEKSKSEKWIYYCSNCGNTHEDNNGDLRGIIYCNICGRIYDPPTISSIKPA